MRWLLLCALLVGVVGCGKKPAAEPDQPGATGTLDKVTPAPAPAVPSVVQITPDNATELIDHPERFKGKTLQGELSLWTNISADRKDSLRNYAGKAVQFEYVAPPFSGKRPPKVRLTITMPDVGELPNAHFPSRLLVTFVCSEGSLTSGNVATSVERPK